MAVQRNPNLFDGVISRAPGYNWVGFMGAFNRTARALAAPGGAFSAAKTTLLAKHVRDACDGLDGIVDGVVSNPAACPATVANVAALRCAGGADTGDTCLPMRNSPLSNLGRATRYTAAAQALQQGIQPHGQRR